MKDISRGVRLSATHALCLQGILLCKKLINKQNGSVIFRLVRLITLYVTRSEKSRLPRTQQRDTLFTIKR